MNDAPLDLILTALTEQQTALELMAGVVDEHTLGAYADTAYAKAALFESEKAIAALTESLKP